MNFLFFYLISLICCYPCKRDDNYGNYSTSITPIQTETPQYDVYELADDLSDQLVWLFFANGTYTWSDNCSSTVNPVVWQVAIAGEVMANTKDSNNLDRATSALKNYRNSTGGYSASMAKNGDIYTDDNAQISWVFTSAYSDTRTESYLEEAKSIIDLIRDHESPNQKGGIYWSINGEYISLISCLETAVAALRYNALSKNDDYVKLAKRAIIYILDNLVDEKDGFIYDGKYPDGSINYGKLTYTIGVLISGCAYLDQLGDTEKNWKAIAVEFGVKFISGGTLNNQFFSDGHINDIIERSHLVFMGLADLLSFTTPSTPYQKQAYDDFKQLIVREARNFRDNNEEIFESNRCPNSSEYGTLIKYASLAQVFKSVSRVVSRI